MKIVMIYKKNYMMIFIFVYFKSQCTWFRKFGEHIVPGVLFFQIIVSFQSEFLIKIDNFCKRDKNYARTRTIFYHAFLFFFFCIEYHKYDSILFCEILFDPIQ